MNLATFISVVVLVLIVSLAIRYIIREKREAPSVSAAPMPDPARSTAKNKVLHIAAIIKHLFRRGGFPPLLLILRKKKQKQGKLE